MCAFPRSKGRNAGTNPSTSKSAAVRQSIQQSHAPALMPYYCPSSRPVRSSPSPTISASGFSKASTTGAQPASSGYNMYIQQYTHSEDTTSSSTSSRVPSCEAFCRGGFSIPPSGAAHGVVASHVPSLSRSTAADPLTVRAAVIGLLAASTRAAIILSALNTAPLLDTQALEVPARELKYFRSTTQLLHKYLRHVELRCLDHPSHAGLIEVDDVIALLTASVMTMSELDTHLVDYEREAVRSPPRGNVYVRHARALAKDASRIAMLESTMAKLLSVLRVDLEAEALRHLTQTKRAISDMVQVDIVLSSRMIHLQHVFGAKATVPVERLEAVTGHPPLPYSVAGSDSVNDLLSYSEATSTDECNGSVTIPLQICSPFSGLTLYDLPSARLIAMPISPAELQACEFYQTAYVNQVDVALKHFAEVGARKKAKSLTQVLGFT